MPRPPRGRRIGYRQQVDFYKPAGAPLSKLTITTINLDEMEAIRLVDAESHTQTEAAEHMDISQPTVARLLESGRKKMARAIVEGQALSIHPGEAPLEFYDGRRSERPCCRPGRGRHHQGRKCTN